MMLLTKEKKMKRNNNARQLVEENQQHKWITRVKLLLNHLHSSSISLHNSSFNQSKSEISPSAVLLFNELQDVLDNSLIQLFDTPHTSINYNIFSNRQVNDLLLLDQNWKSEAHYFDLVHLYIPCINFQKIDQVATCSSLMVCGHLDNISSLDEVIESIFQTQSVAIIAQINRVKSREEKNMILVKLCQKLLARYQCAQCLQLSQYIDEKQSALLQCLFYLKSMRLADALYLVRDRENILSIYTRRLVECYCYVLLGRWDDLEELLNDLDYVNDNSIPLTLRDRSYFAYMKAMLLYERKQWSDCIISIEDCIEFILETFSGATNSHNMLRIQPLLLYAHALDNCFRYEQAELVFIEITNNLFPNNAQGHLQYALFLKKFKNKEKDYMKQLKLALQCKDAQFDEWNEYICSLLNTQTLNVHDPTSNVTDALEILEKLNMNCLKKVAPDFADYNTLNHREHHIRDDWNSMHLDCNHIIQCAFIFMLCARIYGKYLQFELKARKMYEKASQIERYCFNQLNNATIDHSELHYHYVKTMGCEITRLLITREMYEYLKFLNRTIRTDPSQDNEILNVNNFE
jgi:hypothetical protein